MGLRVNRNSATTVDNGARPSEGLAGALADMSIARGIGPADTQSAVETTALQQAANIVRIERTAAMRRRVRNGAVFAAIAVLGGVRNPAFLALAFSGPWIARWSMATHPNAPTPADVARGIVDDVRQVLDATWKMGMSNGQ